MEQGMQKKPFIITGRYARILAVLILSLNFIALPAVADSGSKGQANSVVLQLSWHHQFQFAGYYAAKEYGYFKDEGLNVTIREGGLDCNIIDEVCSDRAQYGVSNCEVLLHRMNGKPLVALAAVFQHSPLVLISRKETGVSNPQDLIGKRVKMTTTSREVELLAMFENEGVSIDYIHFVKDRMAYRDILSPDITAFSGYLTNEPYYLQSRRIDYTVIRPMTYGIDFYGDCLFTTENEVKKHSGRVEAFRRASLKGWCYAMAHVEELIDLIRKKYSPAKTESHLRYEADTMKKLILPQLVEIGHMNPGRWKHIAETFIQFEMAPSDFTLDGFIYDPNPVPDYTWAFWAVGVAVLISFVIGMTGAVLYRLNRMLSHEIQERRETESALRESREQLKLALESASEGIWELELPSRKIYQDARALKIMGFEPEDIKVSGELFSFWTERIHPLDRPEFEKKFNAYLEGQADEYSAEFRIKNKSDQWKWVTSDGKIVKRDENGRPLLMVGINRDITRRKKDEQGLRTNEQRLEEAQRIANIGSWVWDFRENSVVWSRQYYRIFGQNPVRFTPTMEDFFRMVHPDDRDRIRNQINQAIEKREGYTTEFRIVRTDGVTRVLRSRVRISMDPEYQTLRLVGTSQDITEMKEMEAEIEKAARLESIGVLAAGIAHDFNNMLTAVIGNISLAKIYDEKKGRVSTILIEAEKAAEYARDLANRLITFSKGGKPVKKPVALAKLIDTIAQTTLNEKSNLRYRMTMPDDIPIVELDEFQIGHVFQNLFANAAEAMPDGGIVTVKGAYIPIGSQENINLKSNPYVKISVIDQGCGIDPDEVDKIFDPYFSSKQKGQQKGMGLGLTIAHSIVRKHDGRIMVISEKGAGTAVDVYLPSRVKHEKNMEAVQTASVTDQTKKLRVLVMDDEEMICDVAGRMFDILGCETEFAGNGHEAIRKYETALDAGRRFDIVILDLTIPDGMGGKECLERLLQIDKDIRAIVSSGYHDDPVITRYRDYGFRDVLIKPYNLKQLETILGETSE